MRAVWLSSTYYLDEAVQNLSPNAERMLTRALAFCGNAESSGYISELNITMLGLPNPRKLVRELVDARIFTPRPGGGWNFRSWAAWNDSGDKLIERRKADRERQARRRDEQRKSRDSHVTPDAPDTSKNTTNPENFGHFNAKMTPENDPNQPTPAVDNSHRNHADQQHQENVSRDKSRDVTPTEESRGEKNSGYVSSSRSVATADEPRSAPVDPDAWKLVRRIIPAEHPQAVRTELALQASALIKAGTDAALVAEALELWLTKGVHPKTLPSLVSELINTRNRPSTNGTGSKPPPSERKVNAALDLANRFANQPERTALEAR